MEVELSQFHKNKVPFLKILDTALLCKLENLFFIQNLASIIYGMKNTIYGKLKGIKQITNVLVKMKQNNRAQQNEHNHNTHLPQQFPEGRENKYTLGVLLKTDNKQVNKIRKNTFSRSNFFLYSEGALHSMMK